MTESYSIVDPRPEAASAPYTFFLPEPGLIAAVREGDHVKAIIRAVPPSEKYDAERMWIRITALQADWLEGILVSQPYDIPALRPGTAMRVPRSHVIDVDLADPERFPATLEPKRQYWDRCLVDQSVLDGELKVGFLYREAPNMTRDGDEFPDSGWRIRGDTRGDLVHQIESRKAAYVTLGAVLNRDDTWLHLIDESVGASFEKDFEKGIFVPAK